MSDSQCVAVPIEELLVAIPKDHRICIPFQWAEDGTETGHHFIPVGAHAHRAAATIADLRRQLAAKKAEIDEALAVIEGPSTIKEALSIFHTEHVLLHEAREQLAAAIAASAGKE